MQKKKKEKPERHNMSPDSMWEMEVERSKKNTFSKEYQINLSDFALFLSVMKIKEAYEDVLGIILDESDLKLKEVKVEQVILNKSGKRAIRLDAWAMDVRDRQFDMEMQNDAGGDDMRRRSRFYQSMIDTPVLKSGKKTRYKNLPSTVIIFITQEDIFGRDLAMYTFSERCEEMPDLLLGDGTSKIFLNMTSRNGRPELISLLQYMKYTTLDNNNVTVRDERILHLDRIVNEVRQSEEWEAVEMNIFEIGIEKGIERGSLQTLVKNVELCMRNFRVSLQEACEGFEISVEEYEKAKRQIAEWQEEDHNLFAGIGQEE
ncbi:MAG: hypothetical protein K2I53_12475 [Lachnospiraceae bacterium]|nr:hypothetical protein [Lachnospiraceae bacterium]